MQFKFTNFVRLMFTRTADCKLFVNNYIFYTVIKICYKNSWDYVIFLLFHTIFVT